MGNQTRNINPPAALTRCFFKLKSGKERIQRAGIPRW